MSLIYQALRQVEQCGAAPAAARAMPEPRPLPTAAPVPARALAPRWRWLLWGSVLVAFVGLLVGWLGQQQGGELASVPERVPAEALASVVEPALPRAEAPLPVAAPRVVPTPVPAAPVVPLPASPVRAVPATPTSQAVQPAREPTPTPAPISAAPAQAATAGVLPEEAAPVVTPVGPEPAENMGALFDRFNRALAARDHVQAQRHLQTIQASLPASSVARWRAEAWFAYQSGDLDQARDTYLGLLDKLPGDENATLNLVTIEQQLQQPARARAVLEASLRRNRDSVALRAALERLNPGGAGR